MTEGTRLLHNVTVVINPTLGLVDITAELALPRPGPAPVMTTPAAVEILKQVVKDLYDSIDPSEYSPRTMDFIEDAMRLQMEEFLKTFPKPPPLVNMRVSTRQNPWEILNMTGP